MASHSSSSNTSMQVQSSTPSSPPEAVSSTASSTGSTVSESNANRNKLPQSISWDKVQPYLKLLRKAAKNPSNGLPGGQFQTLTKPEQFRRILYKDLPQSELDRLPKSLQDLLYDKTFVDDMPTIIPRAYERAQRVLQSVKNRASAAEGRTMDKETEKSLWPGVFCEGFATELGNIMHESLHMRKALESRLNATQGIAVPVDGMMQELQPEELHDIFYKHESPQKTRGKTQMRQWKTPGWDQLFANDSARLFRRKDIKKTNSFSQVVSELSHRKVGILKATVIELDALRTEKLREEYPGVAAAFDTQNTLPRDLNAFEIKGDTPLHLRLCSLSKKYSHIVKLDWDSSNVGKLDVEGAVDNGFYIKDVMNIPLNATSTNSALLLESLVSVYVVSEKPNGTKSVKLYSRWKPRRYDGSKQELTEVDSNTMVLFRSSEMSLELTVRCEEEQEVQGTGTWFLFVAPMQPSIK